MTNTIDKNIQRQVAAILGWTEAEYSQFIYDCGLAYLNALTPNYPTVILEISKSLVFWNWWKGHWEKREKEYLEMIDESTEPMIDVLEEYKELHEPRALASAIYLNGQVLNESYVNLIANITKAQEEVYAG